MNPLKEIIEQKRSALAAGAKITQDSYDRWLDNECTKRFIAEVEINILENYGATYSGGDPAKAAVIERLTDLIDWKPSELDKNE